MTTRSATTRSDALGGRGRAPRPDNGNHARMEETDMQDIVDKFDLAKEILAMAGTSMPDEQQDDAVKELLGLGVDAIGELIANSRRIAVALETIAENTTPVPLEMVASELGKFELSAETIRPLVERILVDLGLINLPNSRQI